LKVLKLLEDFPQREALKASELKFLEWLFIIFQLTAFVLIVGLLSSVFSIELIAPILDLVSQNISSPLILIFLAVLHFAVILLLFSLSKPFTFYALLIFVGAMVLFSILKLFFLEPTGYKIAGILIYSFCFLYFMTSRRLKVRFFYKKFLEDATKTIICPGCGQEVHLDFENCASCGKLLSADAKFEILKKQILDIDYPIVVRVGKITLLADTFGKKALPFLKEQYDKQLVSPYRNIDIVAAFLKAIKDN